MRGTQLTNILAAFLFSLTLVLTCAVLYTFYPLIILVLNGHWFGRGSHGAQTGGISMIAGGISSRMFFTALVMVPVLFLIIFALLRKRVGRP